MIKPIHQLNPDQRSRLPQYLEKWKAIALSTERINVQQATKAIQALYKAINQPNPKIYVCDSPADVAKVFKNLVRSQLVDETVSLQHLYWDDEKFALLDEMLGLPLQHQINQLQRQLNQQLGKQLRWEAHLELEETLRQPIDQFTYDWQLWEALESNRWLCQQLRDCISSNSLVTDAAWLDFAVEALNCSVDAMKWDAFSAIAQSCGWILPYEKVCIVCDRPVSLAFDAQFRLHAEGKPALQFFDGFSVYAFQGVRLPKIYGELHPHQWRASWLLNESDVDLQRSLIKGIGYGRLSQELSTIELDAWSEYTLLEIDAIVDEEPIVLLKMSCPSTGLIHVVRVPPEIRSAREAVCWINWEVDPETFAVQA